MAIVNSYVSLPEGKQYIPNRPFFPQKGTWRFLKLRGSPPSHPVVMDDHDSVNNQVANGDFGIPPQETPNSS